MSDDQYGRCVVCGRRDEHCGKCHRGHDYAWRDAIWMDSAGRWRNQGGKWVSSVPNEAPPSGALEGGA